MDSGYIDMECNNLDTGHYENTEEINSGTHESTNYLTPGVDQTETDEGGYESLGNGEVATDSKPSPDDVPKRIKLLIYLYMGLFIVLYTVVIVLIVVITVTKEQDGAWSSWGHWTSFSATGRVQSRSRTCSNPIPSLSGKYCDGTPIEVKESNNKSSKERSVAFTASSIYRNSSKPSTLLFQAVNTNKGNGYDNTTGKFICFTPGLYHFDVTLTKDVDQDVDSLITYVRMNTDHKLSLSFNNDDDDIDGAAEYMLSTSGTFLLNRHDTVDVFGIPNYFLGDSYSYFTGFLVTPVP